MPARAFRCLQTRNAPVGALFLLLGATWLSGCAEHATVTSAWQDKAPPNQPFKRVLIVGVSPDLNQRCPFERFLASQTKSESTIAIASCDAVTQKNPLTRESIEAAVVKYQADAVLATKLVAMDWGTEEGGSRDTRGGAYYKATDAGYATGYYGVYGVPVIYADFQTAPSLLTMEGDVQLTSKLFETKGATLVYTMDTKAGNIEARDEGLSLVAAKIADRLRRDGLIR